MLTTDSNTFFQFGLALGLKIYVTQPRASKVSPYVYADFYKYFASITTDNTQVTGEQAGAMAALLSPIGGTFAFGAEYFLSPSFSIGSEIFGLRVGSVSGEYREMMTQTRHNNGYTSLSFYTGITMNFRFQVAASVKSSDDTGDEDRSRRRQPEYAPPPPSNPPPVPTPEAVD